VAWQAGCGAGPAAGAGEQAGSAGWLLGQNGLFPFLLYFLKLFYFQIIF
jgi:hypothetical protein